MLNINNFYTSNNAFKLYDLNSSNNKINNKNITQNNNEEKEIQGLGNLKPCTKAIISELWNNTNIINYKSSESPNDLSNNLDYDEDSIRNSRVNYMNEQWYENLKRYTCITSGIYTNDFSYRFSIYSEELAENSLNLYSDYRITENKGLDKSDNSIYLVPGVVISIKNQNKAIKINKSSVDIIELTSDDTIKGKVGKWLFDDLDGLIRYANGQSNNYHINCFDRGNVQMKIFLTAAGIDINKNFKINGSEFRFIGSSLEKVGDPAFEWLSDENFAKYIDKYSNIFNCEDESDLNISELYNNPIEINLEANSVELTEGTRINLGNGLGLRIDADNKVYVTSIDGQEHSDYDIALANDTALGIEKLLKFDLEKYDEMRSKYSWKYQDAPWYNIDELYEAKEVLKNLGIDTDVPFTINGKTFIKEPDELWTLEPNTTLDTQEETEEIEKPEEKEKLSLDLEKIFKERLKSIIEKHRLDFIKEFEKYKNKNESTI